MESKTSESLVLSVLTQLRKGQVREEVEAFADRFTFKDCGIGIEFEDKKRLIEFFQKRGNFIPTLFALERNDFPPQLKRHLNRGPIL